MEFDKISEQQADYYGRLFQEYGPGVEAVASGKQIYKNLRYEKLCNIFAKDKELSLHDVGFGLGHLYQYIIKSFPDKIVHYSGSEITPDFVTYCRENYPECKFFKRDLSEKVFDDKYDYLIFGGTFYHRISIPVEEFNVFIKKILSNAFNMCQRGIAFNFITGFVEYRYSELFYGEVNEIISFIVRNLSRYFIIDHAYPLYEYTMLVYQENYIAELYNDADFKKYYKFQ